MTVQVDCGMALSRNCGVERREATLKRRRSEHQATFHDDHLLVNGDHPGSRVDAVEREPERFALVLLPG